MTPVAEVENTEGRELKLSRLFAAPRSLVFHLWTDPRYVALWWGVEGATNPTCDMDVRPGGSWHINMRTASGMLYPNGGKYLEVVENERLVYTDIADLSSPAWAQSTRGIAIHTVCFRDEGDGTRVVMNVRFESIEDYDRLVAAGMKNGLNQGLDRLERLLAAKLSEASALPAVRSETASKANEEKAQ